VRPCGLGPHHATELPATTLRSGSHVTPDGARCSLSCYVSLCDRARDAHLDSHMLRPVQQVSLTGRLHQPRLQVYLLAYPPLQLDHRRLHRADLPLQSAVRLARDVVHSTHRVHDISHTWMTHCHGRTVAAPAVACALSLPATAARAAGGLAFLSSPQQPPRMSACPSAAVGSGARSEAFGTGREGRASSGARTC
jgi:hypothetical protein